MQDGIVRRSVSRRLDTPLLTLVVTLVTASLFVLSELAHDGWDAGRFVGAGTTYADAAAVPAGLPVGPGGYDGQFYYRIALDPLTTERTAYGITLDRAAYRQQRILYPAAAWALAGGSAERIPLALIAVNLAAWTLLGWLGALYARGLGRHALWGLLFPLYPGFLITVTRDLTELVGACVLLAALLALQRARPGRAAAALSLAPFARETALGVALVVAGSALLRDLRARARRPSSLALAAPFAVALAWQGVLALRWGRLPVGEGTSSFGPPFVGMLGAIVRNQQIPPVELAVWLAQLAVLAAIIGLTLVALRVGAGRGPLALAWLAYLALNVFYEGDIWSNPAGFLRADLELSLLGIALVLGSETWLRWGLAAALTFGSGVLAITHVAA